MSVYVLPRKKVLDGKGCVWEDFLHLRGWNGLPAEKKVGKVVQSYSGGALVDVHFEAIDYVAKAIFVDELREVTSK
jgi:hypothetical protein